MAEYCIFCSEVVTDDNRGGTCTQCGSTACSDCVGAGYSTCTSCGIPMPKPSGAAPKPAPQPAPKPAPQPASAQFCAFCGDAVAPGDGHRECPACSTASCAECVGAGYETCPSCGKEMPVTGAATGGSGTPVPTDDADDDDDHGGAALSREASRHLMTALYAGAAVLIPILFLMLYQGASY